MEEHLLCFVLVGKELDVINDQDIHMLIKIKEVVPVVGVHSFRILLHKKVGIDVDDCSIRMIRLDFQANGMG